MRPETEGMNNPRRPKKGHNGGEMLLLSEEKGEKLYLLKWGTERP